MDLYFNNFPLQLFTSFFLGMLFSPFSKGFKWYILTMILYEVLYYLYTYEKGYPLYKRILTVVISLIGFIIGRNIFFPKHDTLKFKPDPNMYKNMIEKVKKWISKK